MPDSTKNTVKKGGEEKGRIVKERYHYPSNRKAKWMITEARLLIKCKNISNETENVVKF